MGKTIGIIAAIGCGLLGIALLCVAVLGLAGGSANQTSADSQNSLIGAGIFVVGGGILIVMSIIIGFFSLRRRRGSVPAAPVAPMQTAGPVQRAPAAVQPAVPMPSAPAAQAAAPAPAPAAASSGMDAASQTVYDRIMALNRPTAPYQIIDGRAQNVDLIAEWKIVDAKWYEVFAKASLTKVFRIHMKLDPAKREVRAQDQEMTVSWKAGVPSLSFNASFFKGQQSSVSFGTGYAFTENLAPGQVYKYKFNTNELKKPIQDAVAACGWTYKGVAFGKL